MPCYGYVGATVLPTVYGQLIVKWQVNHAGQLPADLSGKLAFMRLSFALVLLGSARWLGERLTLPKLVGVVIIGIGLAVDSQ